LHHAATRLHQLDLARDLVLHRATERPDGVHVLDLGARPERVRADRTHGHVRVDAHRALFHLHVGDADGLEHGPQLGDVALRLLRAADVGTTHDLHERHAGAVVVDERVIGVVDPASPTDVGGLAGVL